MIVTTVIQCVAEVELMQSVHLEIFLKLLKILVSITFTDIPKSIITFPLIATQLLQERKSNITRTSTIRAMKCITFSTTCNNVSLFIMNNFTINC